MKNRLTFAHKQRIDGAFGKYSRLPANDSEVQAHWSRYMCILVYGFIEQSVTRILVDYAQSKSHRNVANYVESALGRFNSAKVSNVLDVIGHFSPAWRASVETSLTQEMKDSIDSVVANRHSIAHGASTSITFVAVSNYYKQVVGAIEIIEAACC